MQQRVMDTSNIEVLWNSEIKEIVGEEFVEGVKLLNNKTGAVSDLNVTAVFVAIGHKPNTDLFRSFIELDDQGYIVTDKISTKTNIEGVFACGDVQDKIYRQAVTAAGTGCMAALDSERYLGEKGL